ncbi:nuclear transport factor 2 family protein [Aestuariicella hydrocarbonica]|uniref:Nuclear transport factor 2 family protein n=1 Tax=Pseudomaricurvus hydrocarbonicus TaxID=1470433 RepID=A0A9E5MQ13_9GAMM|nr:nuclear transport factor 2 family protein [Aestuariicella hydrocarbonica]NHO68331.1 nuclear transport factor 2 family protein [Aestuariicella hydrocarbonica]
MSVTQDKVEIIDVINLYGVALDSHAWDVLDEVFTEDTHADFGPAGAVWNSVAALKFAFKDFHETLTNHMHTMTGSCIHVDGDTAYALTYGDWLLSRDTAEGGPDWVGRGWYDDVLVRTDKGWRISSRVCRLISWTGNPNVPEPAYEQRPVMTTHTLRSYREQGKVRYFQKIAKKK